MRIRVARDEREREREREALADLNSGLIIFLLAISRGIVAGEKSPRGSKNYLLPLSLSLSFPRPREKLTIIQLRLTN